MDSPKLSHPVSPDSSFYDDSHLPPRKRRKSFTLKNEDHSSITFQSPPPPPPPPPPPRHKRRYSKESKDNPAGKTISSWRKLHEIDILKSILEYYNRNSTYPFDDSTHMQKFYKNWVERRGVYVDEDVFSNKMVELPERFFKNQQTMVMFGGNVKDWMDCWFDESDVEIYRLSLLIWGNKDDDDD